MTNDGVVEADEEVDSYFSERYADRCLNMFPGESTLLELRKRDTLKPPRPQTMPLPSTFRRKKQTSARPLTNTGKAVRTLPRRTRTALVCALLMPSPK